MHASYQYFLCFHPTVFFKSPVPTDDTVVFIDNKLRDGGSLNDSPKSLFTFQNYLFAIPNFMVLGVEFLLRRGICS